MTPPNFTRLNRGWNAEPNAPSPHVEVVGDTVTLRFVLNHMIYKQCAADDLGFLIFDHAGRWRLGPTNDEGWLRNQCRYSGLAPAWGEFYEIEGPAELRDAASDWRRIAPDQTSMRHFLFYLRDETFECVARDWRFVGPHDPA